MPPYAVGIASTLNFQCQAALQGISSGVQAMSARRIGEERPDVAAVPLNAALVMCVFFGVPMAVAGFMAAPSVVPRLTSDPAVIAAAIPYLQARMTSTHPYTTCYEPPPPPPPPLARYGPLTTTFT